MMIGITLGDVCGVGPEILLRAVAAGKLDLNGSCVVYGDLSALEKANEVLKTDVPLQAVATPGEAAEGALNVIDAGHLTASDITVGQLNGKCAAAAVAYVEAAARAALAKEINGFVTLPINKEACRETRPDFEGHTELIAGICGVTDYTMMLASPKMIVTHVSTHVSLQEAIRRVRMERVLTVIRLTAQYTEPLRGRARIAVAGLNPHAGEHGAFGREDMEQIQPAVEAARAEGLDAHGPIPADTLFMKVINGQYDAVVCMYHDQGHVPMKLHGFADAVNITIGLPIVRASVDHGTAFDIAWQGIAHTENFEVALKMCRQLTQH
jgi:4-hydroxythreonine-4-phosphate dehydrogenase